MLETGIANIHWLLNVLFSMAIPITLTLALALTGWALARRYPLKIHLAMLAAASCLTLALAVLQGFVLPSTPPERLPNTLRVAHLNTYIPSLDFAPKLAFAHQSNADIISLQELHTDLTALIRANPPLPYHILSTDITQPYHLPMMLLSRWPISHVQSLGQRLELYRISHPQTPFYVLQIHPHAPHTHTALAARNSQWHMLASTTLPTPLITVGDFNTTPWDESLRPLLKTLHAANHLPTWPTKAPLTPIDNILTSADLPTPQIIRIHVKSSDHLALIADFPLLPHTSK